MKTADMNIAGGLPRKIANLSQGLPHYTHLLAKFSALEAINHSRTEIYKSDYDAAIRAAVEEKSRTLGQDYQKATHSPRRTSSQRSCSHAPLLQDRADLSAQKMSALRLVESCAISMKYKRLFVILTSFSQEPRGPVLKKEGQTRRFQYKFVEPMMQPYVLMKGLAEGLISEEQLDIL